MKNNYFFLVLVVLVVTGCNRPVSRFTVADDDKPAPAEIQFENESKKADFYKWTFGDGDSSFHENPSHIFYKPGEYMITLEAINDKKSTTRNKKIMVAPPEISMVEIETPYGNMIAELYDDTPQHKANFIELTQKGFFDSLLFHRVIDGFMIQGGDPQSRDAGPNVRLGSGGPGYQIPAEMEAGHKHLKGALSAARQGDGVNPEKKSSGSQFYIVHGGEISGDDLKMFSKRNGQSYRDEEIKEYEESGGTPFLDGEYTVFGQVIKGLDVIDKIAEAKTGQGDRPLENITMKITEIK